MSQPLGVRHGRHAGAEVAPALIAAALAALLAWAVANEAVGSEVDALAVTGDLLVGTAWIGVSAALWREERTPRQ